MIKQRSFCLALLLFIFPFGKNVAQGLSAFLDLKDAFWVFDQSETKRIEQLKPLSYKIGANCMAYTYTDQSFKVYQKGRVIKVNDGFTTDYKMSSDYILMINGTSLYVFDKGTGVFLARNPIEYSFSDSIIGFSEPVTRSYYIYAGGQIDTVTDDIVSNPIKVNAIGKNVMAYTTSNDHLMIYYRGKTYEQPVQFVNAVQAGANIVAYKNEYDHQFRVFYKGQTSVLESFEVNAFYTGDNLVAYTTEAGKFKIFYDGETHTVGTFVPGNVTVVDNLLTWTNELGYFMVFYKGETYQLDQYLPNHIEEGMNTLYYIGRDNRVNLFSYGKMEELPLDNYVAVRLDYDVLQVQLPLSQYKFYYKGEIY